VFISRRADVLAPVFSWQGAEPLRPTGAGVWTDDFSNVVSTLVRTWLK
jgi:hypothetical protein